MMRNKILTKITAIVLACLLPVISIVTAHAENFSYTAVTGGTVYVEKYLIMKTQANVPNITFTYSIAAGSGQNASGSNTKVFAGNDSNFVTGTPTIGTAVFAQGQTTYTSVQDIETTGTKTAANKKDPVTLVSGEKYARSKIAVNFGSVSFKEPGIYRWIITESAYDTTLGVSDYESNAKKTRAIDVYVEATGSDGKSLTVAGYVLHNSADDAAVPKAYASGDPTTKTNGYISKYTTENLTISKMVSGNQASRDEFFEINVSITGAIAGTKYDVDLSNASATTVITGYNSTTKTNPAFITTNSSGTGTAQFWLQGGQSVIIKGLAENTSYSINENKTTMQNEGYVPSATISGDTKKSDNSSIAMNSNYVVEDDKITADTIVTYTNTKTGSVPTGVITSSLPGMFLMSAGLVLFFALNRRKIYAKN